MDEKQKNRIYTVAIIVFAACLYFVCLEQRQLWGPDEPRVAGIAAEMAITGDMVIPRLNGRPFLEKPPLYYWISSLAYRFLGETTFTAKLSSAIAAFLSVLLVYVLARRQNYSHIQSLSAALVLATSFEYFTLGRRCLIDMLLCLFVLGAMLSFYQVHLGLRHKGWWMLGFTGSLAGAVLTKGLVGPVIVIVSIVSWLALTRTRNYKPYLMFFSGVILSLIPAGVWLIYLYQRLGYDAVHEVLWVNNFGRFTGSFAQHTRPFYYYFIKLPGQFLPWTVFLPYALICQVRKLRPAVDRTALFNLLWLAVPFLVLSLSAGKRGMYLLPLYPAAALMVGAAIGQAIEKQLEGDLWFEIPAGILVWMVILMPLGLGITYIYMQKSVLGMIVSLPALFLGLWACKNIKTKQWENVFGIAITGVFVLLLIFDSIILPLFNSQKSFEPLFAHCRSLEKNGDDIVLYNPTERISGAALFYLKHKLPVTVPADFLPENMAADKKPFF